MRRAVALAEPMPEAAAADDIHDVLTGKAGAIPPLLALARRTGDARDAFVPGLLPGVGGVAYQLLRAHLESELPSILTVGGRASWRSAMSP